jgi:RHS repeat-associated protein
VPVPARAPELTLPTGGGEGVSTLGETFQATGNGGTATASVPLPLPEARGAEPEMELEYSSASGNGPFGMGWELAVPAVERSTRRGVPRYDAADVFELAGEGPLVPVHGGTRPAEGGGTVTRYVARLEGPFSRIERHTAPSGETHWRVTDRDGVETAYGLTAASRVADPADPLRVWQWLADESRDPLGNRVVYDYVPEDDACVPPESRVEAHRSHAARYLRRVRYGNWTDGGGVERWAFEVELDYGACAADAAVWPLRADPFSTYRPGFEVRTRRLCHGVLVYHAFPEELGEPRTLVSALRLEYRQEPGGSLLTRVQLEGHGSQNDPSAVQRMPPLTFGYTTFDPGRAAWRPLVLKEVAGGRSFAGEEWELVDLEGEGIPGLLYADGESVLCWQPRGGGAFTGPALPQTFPVDRALDEEAVYTLQDLDGNGPLELVVDLPGRNGYYPRRDDGWGSFVAFPAWAVAAGEPGTETASFSGNGRADLLVAASGRASFYPSLGTGGYGPPEARVLPAGFPAGGTTAAAARFADVVGDGLAHRVLVRSGDVQLWPSLGHGRFGAAVGLEGAPEPGGELDAARLFMADLAGSGAADLVYAWPDRLELFINQGGNGFAAPVAIPLPRPYDPTARISFTDVAGNGTTAIVVSWADPEAGSAWLDLNGGVRPRLLAESANGMGVSTRLAYASSTRFLLEDRRAGTPWATRLYFPVNVVETVETWDQVSGVKAVTRFAYHDGWFDPVERVFRGFGRVDTWDSRRFEAYAGEALHAAAVPAVLDPALHVAPTLTRTWYHLGAWPPPPGLDAQQAAAFFHDPAAGPPPESALDPAVDRGDALAMAQAHGALAGHPLREEVYGDDGGPDAAVPYTVTAYAWYVRQVQAPGAGTPAGSYAVLPRETVEYDYERDPADPRVEQGFTLEVDPCGSPVLECTAWYPRRGSGAEAPLARAALSEWINLTDPAWRLGIPVTRASYQVTGLAPAGARLTWAEAAAQVAAALENRLPFDVPAAPGERAARLLERYADRYWNAARTAPLPVGETTALALGYDTARAVFPPSLVDAVFNPDPQDPRITPALLETEGGYRLEDGYWWNPGTTWIYAGPEGFYQPVEMVDPFGARTALAYDRYALLVVEDTDCRGRVTRARNDYRVLEPRHVTDVNGNVHEALFTPLGHVLATSVHGVTLGERRGDEDLDAFIVRHPASLAEVLDDPHRFLQGATSFYWYDLLAWEARGEPPLALTVERLVHVSDLPPGEASPLRMGATWIDGFGRVVQEKVRMDPAAVPAGHPDLLAAPGLSARDAADAAEVWLVTGAQLYNNKGEPVLKFQPFYLAYASSADVGYTGEPELVRHGVADRYFYDPLLRVVKVETPRGFHTRRVIRAWELEEWDEDDTVTSTRAYLDHVCDTSPAFAAEREALVQAATLAGTPVVQGYDGRGLVVRVTRTDVRVEAVTDRCGQVPPGDDPIQVVRTLTPLTTTIARDAAGEVAAVTDPRLAAENGDRAVPIHNFAYVRDMAGAPLLTDSVDAGPYRSLNDATGSEIRGWDARDTGFRYAYDCAGNILTVHATPAGGAETMLEELAYGDDPDRNQVGRLVLLRDHAGEVRYPLYGLEGEVLERVRTLAAAPAGVPDWSRAAAGALGDETFTLAYAYDVLGRLVMEENGDGSVARYGWHAPGWLRDASLETGDGVHPVLVLATYDAKGQRHEARLGCGATARAAYDPRTFRLARKWAERDGDGARVQDASYTYDPVGNVTRVDDHTLALVYGVAEEPPRRYAYDGLYRVVSATGSEPEAAVEDPGTLPPLVPYTEAFTYDDGGNLRLTEHAGAVTWARAIDVAEGSNRGVPAGMAGDGQSPGDFFDPNGNQTALDDLSFAWALRNQLATADDTGDGTASVYTYDAGGERVREVVRQADGTVRERIQVGLLTVERTTPPGGAPVETRTVRMTDGRVPLVVHATGGGGPAWRYPLTDDLGSVTVELDGDGAVATVEQYAPYGETTLLAGASGAVETKVHRYSGEPRDRATGLYCYGLRYYPPTAGRWISADPLGADHGGTNLFAFVDGNPVSRFDVGGLMPSKTKKKKPRFDVRVALRSKGGWKLKVQGRPKKFATSTLRRLKANSPAHFFAKGNSTNLANPSLYSRNHILPWMTIAKAPRTATRGLPLTGTSGSFESFLRSVVVTKFHVPRFKSQFTKIVAKKTLSQSDIERGFKILVQDQYNDPDNLYVGLSSANSSGGSSMKANRNALRNHASGTKTLTSSQVTTQKTEFKKNSLDFPPGLSPAIQTEKTNTFVFAWSGTVGKYT